MKCKQKLCQRNKSLQENGNCNVCDDVIVEALKKQNDLVSKKPTLANIQVDLKVLVDVHKKLSNGTPISQERVSSLMLAGIINMLNQHDTIAALEERVQANDIENVTRNVRVESLENWVMKQEEAIKHLKEKLGGSNLEKDQEVIENVNILETKVKALESNLQRLEASKTKSSVSASPNKDKCCKECDQTFAKNFELEIHMVTFHGFEKKHSCELCGKRLFLKWRLRKHLSVHEKSTKPCKYFTNGNICPFDEVGCKFLHENNPDEENIEETGVRHTIDCIYCNILVETHTDLIVHMSNKHMDKFSHIQQQDDFITF